MCLCASCGDLETLGSWLDAGADVNQPDYDGRTALHIVRLYNFTSVEGFTEFSIQNIELYKVVKRNNSHNDGIHFAGCENGK